MSEHAARLPLAGVRVISFGAFVAGNMSATTLAELGADVVKIEPRSRPEALRGPVFAFRHVYTEPSGVTNTMTFAGIARSVRGLALDLGVPEGRAVFHRLVARADVVVENFGGATLRRWGCDYEDLLADNARLVMLSLSGFGRSGPRAGYLAYASTIAGYVGLADAWGGFSHGTHSDHVTSVTGVLGTVAAIRTALASGQPCHLDVAQIDAMTSVMAPTLLDPLVNDAFETPAPNWVEGSLFSGVFPAQGTDTWLALELEDVGDWNTLCRVLEAPELSVEDEAAAAAKRDGLETAVRSWISSRRPHTAMHLLQQEGLAAGVVQNAEDVWRDPQLRTRGFPVQMDHPDMGPITYARPPSYRMEKTPGQMRRTAPRLGQHTDEILREWLALGDDDLTALSAAGAIFDLDREVERR